MDDAATVGVGEGIAIKDKSDGWTDRNSSVVRTGIKDLEEWD